MDDPGLEASKRLPDVAAFLAEIRHAQDHPLLRSFVDPARALTVARAPGRLDLMGGIADYSGALVLQWPLREAALAAVQRDPEPVLRVLSLGEEGARAFEMPTRALWSLGAPARDEAALAYDEAQTFFRRRAEDAWAGYILGNVLVLMRECSLRLEGGLRILVRSHVPEGKGVSSSAAVEVAVMSALVRAFGIDLTPRGMALLCQRTENRVVGAACGIMDQMASACGREGELLALLCRPAEVLGYRRLPDDLEIWGVDSGERHAVSGSDYTGVRVGAFMGKKILEGITGRRLDYLTEIESSELEPEMNNLPERIEGQEFLNGYGTTGDLLTRVDRRRHYPVRAPTIHPVNEHLRVQAFSELLTRPSGASRDLALGELMYASHASYSACGLGSPGTDRLVALAREKGPAHGFFGAKITGGGSGGTVAVLGRRGADIEPIVAAYAREAGHRPQVFSGSSPGAFAFVLP